jgi:hypothetical protein
VNRRDLPYALGYGLSSDAIGNKLRTEWLPLPQKEFRFIPPLQEKVPVPNISTMEMRLSLYRQAYKIIK